MFANHPQVAKRWAAMTDQSSLPERKSKKKGDSRGLPHPKRTDATDFKHLHPGPKARHGYSKPAKEQDAMEEATGIQFQPGSRGHHLNKFKRK